MRSDPLTLEHPVDRLELFDLDTDAWTALDAPELYLVDNAAVIPLQAEYMPDLLFVEIEGQGSVEFTVKNRAGYLFKLNCEVSDVWLTFFERLRGDINATVNKQTLTLRCDSKELKAKHEKIRRAVHQATRDYRKEREALVWRVYEKMRTLEMNRCIEAEIQSELRNYKQKRLEQERFAREKGYSLTLILENFNVYYRGVLENKFKWWAGSLDAATIEKYKAMFEQELVVS